MGWYFKNFSFRLPRPVISTSNRSEIAYRISSQSLNHKDTRLMRYSDVAIFDLRGHPNRISGTHPSFDESRFALSSSHFPSREGNRFTSGLFSIGGFCYKGLRPMLLLLSLRDFLSAKVYLHTARIVLEIGICNLSLE